MSKKKPYWVITGELDGVTGFCSKCGREVPAIGLVPVNDVSKSKHEPPKRCLKHLCADCAPRQFGKVRGKGALALIFSSGIIPSK